MSFAARLRSIPDRTKRGIRHFVFNFLRVPGGWYIDDISRATSLVVNVEGDFIEMGAFFGHTTRKLVPIAKSQGKKCHAVDSFEGMAAPTRFDQRAEGNLSIGGPSAFYATMDSAGLDRDSYEVHVGFIPDILSTIPVRPYSFAIVDLDNYAPTRDAIEWLWPQMSVGGIVAFDDFSPGLQLESPRAVKEFLARQTDVCIAGLQNHQLYVVKWAGELSTQPYMLNRA